MRNPLVSSIVVSLVTALSLSASSCPAAEAVADSMAIQLEIVDSPASLHGIRALVGGRGIPTPQWTDSLVGVLVERCLAEGFGGVRVTVQRGDSLYFRVLPGEVWPMGSVRFVGATRFTSAALTAGMYVREGQPFDSALLKSDLERIVESYGERGCLFAVLRPRPSRGRGGRVDVVVTVDEGPRVRLGRLHVEGLRRTQQATVLRASGLVEGEVVRRGDFERAGDRLRHLGYFTSVSGPRMVRGEEADQVDGVVRIEEAATHSIEGVVGYAPGAEQESGEWTGYFDASLRNMFGSGRELAVSWAKVQGDEFNFHVSFRERWLLGSQLSVAGTFDQVVQDSTYLEDEIALELAYPLGRDVEGALGFGRRRVLPGRRTDGLAPLGTLTQTVTLSAHVDRRDNPLNPSRGVQLSAAVDLGRRATGTLVRAVTDCEIDLPVRSRQVCSVRLVALALETPPGPIQSPDLFRVGGAGSLRGYREDELRVVRGGLGEIEYRFLTGHASRLAVFVDLAHVRRLEATSTGVAYPWTTLAGYGIGLRVGSRAGTVGIDYATAAGDAVTQGKLHIGIENRF